MTKVCIIGGKLQGVEALYLAGKAGMETTLVDHRESPLGKNFCGRFIQQDVLQYNMNLVEILEEADFVLPALEDSEVLATLRSLADTYDINLVYDPHAYAISSSKKISDEKMAAAGLPCPCYYPEGDFPYIVKPSDMSGSEGVAKIHNADEMKAFLKDHPQGEWIAQEFLDGPSFSLEVIGTPGDYETYHVTELFMDPAYDCKRVLSCPDFPVEAKEQMEKEIVALAELVQLHGIMDLEVIESKGTMKILEIDARIPSQTPITVYHATGRNFMTELAAKFGKTPTEGSVVLPKERYVSLEQILCEKDTVSVLGEHIMTKAEGLHHRFDFCGADEALTDYAEGKNSWVATLICIADTKEDLAAKRNAIPQRIGEMLGKEIEFIDAFPAES